MPLRQPHQLAGQATLGKQAVKGMLQPWLPLVACLPSRHCCVQLLQLLCQRRNRLILGLWVARGIVPG